MPSANGTGHSNRSAGGRGGGAGTDVCAGAGICVGNCFGSGVDFAVCVGNGTNARNDNGTDLAVDTGTGTGNNDKCRALPTTTSASSSAVRPAGDRPDRPSSPQPMIVNQADRSVTSAMRNILVLGGTLEASALVQALAERGERVVLSYAGRVAQPKLQPVPMRVGGFGGMAGLVRHLHDDRVTHVVDATHPFAAQMSAHAVAACSQAGVPLLALTRPAWQPVPGDRWQEVADLPAAAAALGGPPQRVMLALGRLHLAAFATQPQHHYLLRLVDAPEAAPPLPHHTVVVARGPFDLAGDIDLLRAHRIDLVVCKNAGGTGAVAKLQAARALGLPVVMVTRPPLPARDEVASVAEVLRWLGHVDSDAGAGAGADADADADADAASVAGASADADAGADADAEARSAEAGSGGAERGV